MGIVPARGRVGIGVDGDGTPGSISSHKDAHVNLDVVLDIVDGISVKKKSVRLYDRV